MPSRQVESPLALSYGNIQALSQDFKIGVIRKLEIVDAGHDAWQIIIRRIWRLTRLADNSEHGCQALETCETRLVLWSCSSFKALLTSDGELGATSDELEKFAALRWG